MVIACNPKYLITISIATSPCRTLLIESINNFVTNKCRLGIIACPIFKKIENIISNFATYQKYSTNRMLTRVINLSLDIVNIPCIPHSVE